MSRVAIDLAKDIAIEDVPEDVVEDVEAQNDDGEGIKTVKSFDKFGVDFNPRSSTLLGFIVNNANTMVGAGILALPWTLSQTGWVLGILMLIFGAAVTNLGLHQLAMVSAYLKGDQLSFGNVAERAHRFLPVLSSFILWYFTFIMCIIYLGTAADYLVSAAEYFAPAGASGEWYLQRINWVLICFFVIGLPLSVPRKTTVLQYTSFLAVIFIVYTTILCAVTAFAPLDELCSTFLANQNMSTCLDDACCSPLDSSNCCIGEVLAVGTDPVAIISSFPTMITAFAAACAFFPLFNDLKKPTVSRLKIGTTSALVLVSILYYILSLFSYFTYGSAIQSNVLQSYPMNTSFTVARLGMAVLLCFSYPLLMHPCRDSMLDLMDRAATCLKANELSSTAMSIRYYAVVLLCNLLTFVVASLGVDISILLNIAGSLAVTWISFILPGAYFLLILGKDGEATRWQKYAAYFLIAFGIFIMVFNIILWFV